MTAQIADRYTYNGEEYQLIATTEPLQFCPYDYGFNPSSPHTACWAGYFCEYAVKDDALLLQKLNVFCEDGNYPDLFGISGEPPKGKYDSFVTYPDLKHQMDYSGSIVLGSGFIKKYYLHMGFQRAWAYETVLELKFEKGRLIETVDHSQFVKALREKVDTEPDKFISRCVGQYVGESFSLDARDKVWWICEDEA